MSAVAARRLTSAVLVSLAMVSMLVARAHCREETALIAVTDVVTPSLLRLHLLEHLLRGRLANGGAGTNSSW